MRPRLNTRSATTDVAVKHILVHNLPTQNSEEKQTWNCKVIKCHPREARKRGTALKPPKEDIIYLFRIGTQITG